MLESKPAFRIKAIRIVLTKKLFKKQNELQNEQHMFNYTASFKLNVFDFAKKHGVKIASHEFSVQPKMI